MAVFTRAVSPSHGYRYIHLSKTCTAIAPRWKWWWVSQLSRTFRKKMQNLSPWHARCDTSMLIQVDIRSWCPCQPHFNVLLPLHPQPRKHTWLANSATISPGSCHNRHKNRHTAICPLHAVNSVLICRTMWPFLRLGAVCRGTMLLISLLLRKHWPRTSATFISRVVRLLASFYDRLCKQTLNATH